MIDRAELKALLERVGGGADEVPLVRRVWVSGVCLRSLASSRVSRAAAAVRVHS